MKKLKAEQAWNTYWKTKTSKTQASYNRVASFYRRFIIKRALNKVLAKEFNKDSNLLHAGCGSGEVDIDNVRRFNITALDISKKALSLYRENNRKKIKTIHASIFNIPIKDNFYDGIYNLGVMEHFTKKENLQALEEFYRVLKANGRIVLFWPPKFGLSVIFLNSTHYLLNNIFKRNIRLHPNEISLIESEKEVKKIFELIGFKVTKFYFGPLDLFTHCIIVAKK